MKWPTFETEPGVWTDNTQAVVARCEALMRTGQYDIPVEGLTILFHQGIIPGSDGYCSVRLR